MARIPLTLALGITIALSMLQARPALAHDASILACVDQDGDGYGAVPDASCPFGLVADCDDELDYCLGNCSDGDGDGVPDCKDTCPFDPDAGQEDADGDGIGDACDPCSAADADGDQVCDAPDNCPLWPNTDQDDEDLDGVGNACDGCPGGATADLDGDGVCDAFDECPASSTSTSPVRLNAPLTLHGSVVEYRTSPDGEWVVYRADQDVARRYELYVVPAAGGAVTKLNGPLVAGGDVVSFAISEDSAAVVYRADQTIDGRFDLYSVPLAGGVATRLTGAAPSGVEPQFGIAPDGTRVVVRGRQPTLHDNLIYFGVPIGGGTLDAIEPPLLENEDVSAQFEISPDSNRLVFGSWLPSGESQGRVWTATLDGSSVTEVPLPHGFDGCSLGTVTADSLWILTVCSHPLSSYHLFHAPIDGAWSIELSNNGNGMDFLDLHATTPVSVGGRLRALFSWRKSGTQRLSVVPVDGSSPLPVTLDDGMAVDGRLTSDASTFVYQRGAPRQLRRVSVLGGTPVVLTPPLVAGGAITGFELTPDDQRAVYLADQDVDDRMELFGVPLAGGASLKLSGTLAPGGNVTGFVVSPLSDVAVYRADQEADEVFDLYLLRVSGGVPRRLNLTLAPGHDTSGEFSITADGSRIVYRSGDAGTGVFELYSTSLDVDTDGDDVVDRCDCAEDDDGSSAFPGVVAGLFVDRAAEDVSTAVLTWDATFPGGTSVSYDVLRSEQRDGFSTLGASITTVESGMDTVAEDPAIPGSIFYYIVRSSNACGAGPLGNGRAAFDFENGGAGWSHTSFDGGTDSWHLAGQSCFLDPLPSTMFVSNGNAGLDCVDDSSREASRLISPPVILQPTGPLRLAFDALSFDEGGTCLAFGLFDNHDVGVSTDGGQSYTLLNDCTALTEGDGLLVHHEFDIGAWAGMQVQFVFATDTVDLGFGHTFAVDNVVVVRVSP